ncbi:glycine/sarcosine/betaine reductase selenoprotein B family protein [Catenulispora pinisilvae]|uniref:glycine/sarcosine/betaine reductase selenoprotein B family protein n=1 Tax=Catenulispora pinisilvae TaxID=2705253 RepID=UPI001890E4FE|nr:glycine/sarcosine/betaine reductase selenoprotein B family protein [Catenulispora pinisilvae]
MTDVDQTTSGLGVPGFPVFDPDSLLRNVLGIEPEPLPDFDPPALTPMGVPLREATVGLLVSCGAYFPDQPRLGQHSDLSYRLLPRERGLDEVLFGHMTPIRAFALADPNVAYPRDTMLDLERDGVIGRYAAAAVSMVGSISQFDELATGVAPRIVEEFQAMGVDLVLVVPFCPQCHVAFGVLARAIEKRGIPTTSITTLYKQATYLKPPRASFLDFPLGCPAGRPREQAQQREIVKAALEHAEQAGPDWELERLPFQWDADGNRDWEALVADVYRLDNAIRGSVLANAAAHTQVLGGGNEREFAVRCAC